LVALVALAGAFAFAPRPAHTGSPQASRGAAARAMTRSLGSGLPSAASMPATPEYSGSDGPSLSNDADNQEDGTGDPLGSFAVVALLVLLLLVRWFLLAFWDEPAKPSFIPLLALERPG
jgi:hypothetical protein